MKNIIIFTGSGLSNILGLPTVLEFQELIKKSEKYGLSEILNETLGQNKNDIEYVMYALEEFHANDTPSIAKTLIKKPSYFINNLHPPSNTSIIQTIKERTANYLTEIKHNLYTILDAFNANDAANLYFNIIQEIKLKFPESQITFFTANYDLTFEKSIPLIYKKLQSIGIEDVYYGFSAKFGSMVFDNTLQKQKKEVIGYYKIHGSLDWHYDPDLICTKSGTNAKPANPNEMPILYPGFKGRPMKSPFDQLHTLFFEQCKTADAFISIGFALRDPYINELLQYAHHVNSKILFYYFNPIEIDNMPKESGVHMLSTCYRERFVYHNKKVSNSEQPFGENWVNETK